MEKKDYNRRRWELLHYRLGLKTKALWIASEILHERVEPTKKTEQIYEYLKLLGKQEYNKEKPEKLEYLKSEAM